MRNQLLLLLLLSLSLPTLSTAAIMHTLELEFAYTPPATLEQQVLGYRLYKDGEQVCETSVSSASPSITCDILTEDGTFNFTLTAFYSNDTESPQSPPFPYTIGSTSAALPADQVDTPLLNTTGKKTVAYSWSVPDITGYRMYMNDTTLCETTDRDSTSLHCIADLVSEPMAFSITSLYSNGTESQKSNILLLDPVNTLAKTTGKKIITYSWSVPDVTGYRMYMNDTILCETTNRDSTTLRCIADLVNEPMAFSITSLYSNGTESQKSNILLLDPTAVSEELLNATLTGSESVNDITRYTSDLGDSGSEKATLSSTAATQPPTAIIASTTAAGKADLVVNFDGTLSTSTSPLVSYHWTFGDGSEATGEATAHSFTTAGTFSTTLTVVDSLGHRDSVSTPIMVTGSDAEGEIPNVITVPEDNLNIEIGTVSIEHEWIKVYFKNSFNNPIVITNPPGVNSSQAALVRIDNIDQEGFEIHIDDWAYLAELPSFATINYMVIEAGNYTLDNGIRFEAGSFSGSTTSQKVILQETYTTAPVILTQVITGTGNESGTVTSRVRRIRESSFKHQLFQEQNIPTTEPREERTDYIAWEPSQGEAFGLQYEIGIVDNTVTPEWIDINFRAKFGDLPFFFADAQTTNSEDVTTLVYQQLSQTAVQVKIEAQQSFDSETTHIPEVFGYFIMGAAQ